MGQKTAKPLHVLCLTIITGKMLASSCFSRNASVSLHQMRWQLSCPLFWCYLALIFNSVPRISYCVGTTSCKMIYPSLLRYKDYEPEHVILVLIAHAHSTGTVSTNSANCAGLSRMMPGGDRCLNFGLNFQLYLNFEYASSEGSDEFTQTHQSLFG